MMRYLILNILVVGILMLVALVVRPKIFTERRFWITLGVLLVLTAIFDNVIIALDVVSYHREHILGWHLYKAPVEDFFYTVAVAILIPLVWRQDENE